MLLNALLGTRTMELSMLSECEKSTINMYIMSGEPLFKSLPFNATDNERRTA